LEQLQRPGRTQGWPFGFLLGVGSGLTYGVWNWQAVGTAQSTWGFVVQGGYFILDPWQVYAR